MRDISESGLKKIVLPKGDEVRFIYIALFSMCSISVHRTLDKNPTLMEQIIHGIIIKH